MVALLPHNDYPARAKAERLVGHLHRLGPRAVAELLDEICRHHGLADDVLGRLEVYSRLSSEMLKAAGGDRFTPAPVHPISGTSP